MNKPSVNVPFATIPPKQYVRTEPGGVRPKPTRLYKALVEELDPLAWTNYEIAVPLVDKMCDRFYEADLMRQIVGEIPPLVKPEELVPMEGTDKPAVLGKDEKPIMFVRVVTPRYSKDLSELGLKPNMIDEIIIESGADMAKEVARLFLHGLNTEIEAIDPLTANPLLPLYNLRGLDELKGGEFSLLIHPDTVSGLNKPDTVTAIHLSEEVPKDSVYVLPAGMVISYRNLLRPQFWIERTAYLVEFFCWVEVGSTISNTDGLCRFRLPKPAVAIA